MLMVMFFYSLSVRTICGACEYCSFLETCKVVGLLIIKDIVCEPEDEEVKVTGALRHMLL
jgi:hypothetical protein